MALSFAFRQIVCLYLFSLKIVCGFYLNYLVIGQQWIQKEVASSGQLWLTNGYTFLTMSGRGGVLPLKTLGILEMPPDRV